jgi:RNA polymerase sigma-70 factor, ECF subfamily
MLEFNQDEFIAGDHDHFKNLIRAYEPRLRRCAEAILGDSDEADDAVQVTMIRAYERRASYGRNESFPSWMMAICRNVCLDTRRAAIKRSLRECDKVQDMIGAQIAEEVESREILARIYEAIDTLPPRERMIAQYRWIDGLDTRETAERVGIATGTVKATLNHAMKKLRPLLSNLR